MRDLKHGIPIRNIVGPFDRLSLSHLLRNTRGMIERIRDDGRIYWKSDADAQKRWNRSCDDMINAMASAYSRRHDPLEHVLRDTIHVYEHSERRLVEMMKASSIDESSWVPFLVWIEATFRAAIYAITAMWLDDKHDLTTMTLEIDIGTGETTDDIQYTPPTTPRKYRKKAKGM